MKKTFLTIICLLAAFATFAESGKTTLPGGGSKLELPVNYVRNNTFLSAEFSFKEFTSLTVGRGGEGVYRGAWIEVTPIYVIVHECYLHNVKRPDGSVKGVFDNKIREAYRHGMKISSNLRISVDAGYKKALVELKSGNSRWSMEINWDAGGAPFVRNDGAVPVEASVDFERRDMGKSIWMYGDSYASYGVSRWIYYAVREHSETFMMDNLPGGNSKDLLAAFKSDLALRKPEYAVWMLGMNDRSDDSDPNEDWQEAVNEFITLCKLNGITPILTTIPNVPKRYHGEKSAWVRKSSGCRYIDWAKAVESTSDGVWAEGCLSNDKVHPTADGAIRLWERIKKDFPEIASK